VVHPVFRNSFQTKQCLDVLQRNAWQQRCTSTIKAPSQRPATAG